MAGKACSQRFRMTSSRITNRCTGKQENQNTQTHENFPVVSARPVITRICAAVILLFAVAGVLSAAYAETELPVLVEAEGFADTGGWVIDLQFIRHTTVQ
jgi:hypothetical protein